MTAARNLRLQYKDTARTHFRAQVVNCFLGVERPVQTERPSQMPSREGASDWPFARSARASSAVA